MTRKHVAVMLCGAAVAYACAPRNRSATEGDAHQFPAAVEYTADSAHGLALTVAENDDSRAMSFELELRNTENKLTEVRFANGRTHDFVVLDDHDREVWRWSEGRLFTQTLQTKQLQKGEALRYTAEWETPRPGRYRVVATLNSDEHAQPITQEFVVRSLAERTNAASTAAAR